MDVLKRNVALLVTVMLLLFAAVSIRLAWDDSTTMDEKAHIPASYSYVKYLDMRINPEHPPLIKDLSGLAIAFALPNVNFPVPSRLWEHGDENVDPANHPEGPAKTWGLAQWSFGDQFLFGMGNNPDTITFFARLPIVLIAVLLGLAIFLWTRELSGTLAGLFALLLFVADPNIIGHSHYVTTDIGIAAFIFFSTYFFVAFLKNPSWKSVMLSGFFLGLAELAKFSAVILFPLFGIILLLFVWSLRKPEESEETHFSWKLKKFFEYLSKFSVSILVCFATIWALYVPNVWNMPVETVQEIARAQFPNDRAVGRLAESTIITMSELPLMKPLAHYFLGVFMVFARVAGGNTYYFLGEVSNQASSWYFPAVFVMKSTLPFLALLGFSLVYAIVRFAKSFGKARETNESFFSRRARSFETHVAEYTMGSFVVLYSYLSITGNLNIGFRHLFPILPFLFVLVTEALFTYWRRHQGNKTVWSICRALIFFLTLWIALIPIFAYPSYLSYFNTAMGGPKNGYRYVTDSNYDWGQDVKRLRDWIETYNRCIEVGSQSSETCLRLTDGRPFPTDTPLEKIRVDYFGGSSPEYFLGEKYISWHSHLPPEAGWYAVSAGFYQESRYRKDTPPGSIDYSWFPKDAKVGRAGDSIFLFFVRNAPMPPQEEGR